MFFRLRNWWNYTRFTWQTRGIRSTPPLPCDPQAGCELHTMLGTRDLPLYLIAVKSFLRFYPSVAVVMHNDGSLSPAELDLLRFHVPGCRIISPAEGEKQTKEALGADSFLFQCRSWDVNYRRLIDTDVLSATRKRIIMDSDVITLRPPEEVIDWIESGTGPFLIGRPPKQSQQPPPADLNGAHVQTIFKAKLNELSAGAGLPTRFADGTTAGFYGCCEDIPLDQLQRVIQTCQELQMPMHHWGSDQCLVIYFLSIANARILHNDHYFNFWPEELPHVPHAHVIHFLGTNRFYQGVYARQARRVISDLQTGVKKPATIG